MRLANEAHYDVIVIGAGHAGCEAALAAARLGARTLLLTSNLDTIAAMPCNCSIGGPAKAHLVREIDALGGEMARNIDRTFTHIRLLNASKGPAVQALRAQADKALYRASMKSVIEGQRDLSLRQDTAVDLLTADGGVERVVTAAGATYYAPNVVVAAGTFLNGMIHMGLVTTPAGRAGEPPSIHLAAALQRLGFDFRRFKTGTVPRVALRSLDTAEIAVQPSAQDPLRFSRHNVERPHTPLLPCYITATNADTHELLRRNSHLSALWGGRIAGTGPRYCPSIEAKLIRFPQRTAHTIFLEQEGWHTQEVYVQGMSNSLPPDVQLAMLRTLPGMRQCEMFRPGYAIEYDCIDCRQLSPTLQALHCRGLYLAGQICGTSGYEEAAGQGLVAGINAGRAVQGRPPVVIPRSAGYLGVMLSDITSAGLDEPYRLLTSRAEHRLSFGQDWAWFRLRDVADEVMRAVPPGPRADRDARTDASSANADRWSLHLRGRTPERQDLQKPGGSPEAYAPYVSREAAHARRVRRSGDARIHPDFDFAQLPLRLEARERLAALRPATIGDAAAIPGVTPADLGVLTAYVLRHTTQARDREPNTVSRET